MQVRLAWSAFRRRHQAIAKHCHCVRRERTHPPSSSAPIIHRLSSSLVELTDTRWERIAALLPPPSIGGRPAQDHRRLLAGMLWIMRTGATWREVPPHFGSWHTVYTRYQDWRTVGIWHGILAMLDPDPPVDHE
ncbi:MAG: transposase [Chloroflexota bacterium]|nr:transposase [Chloroflexota bacterium]